MINLFKPFNINEKDINNLKNVNDYWKNQVIKNIKKLNKWLTKFNNANSIFYLSYPEKYDSYILFFKQIKNYENFFNQHYKNIVSNSKVLAKFYKFIADYVEILGWTKAIELICKFFYDIEHNDVANRQIHGLKILNHCIEHYFEIFKNKTINNIKDDKFLEKLFLTLFIKENKAIEIDYIIKEILKYNKLLFKKKQITERILINQNVICLEIIIFVNSLKYYYLLFFKNVR